MRALPARFIGEFSTTRAAHDACKAHPDGEVPVAYVVVGPTERAGSGIYTARWWQVGSEVIVVRCGCGDIDLMPVRDRSAYGNPLRDNGARWVLVAREPVEMAPSVVQTLGGGGGPILKRCHYLVRGGRFEPLPDSVPWDHERT